jgi:hypothetical protein
VLNATARTPAATLYFRFIRIGIPAGWWCLP